MRDEKILNVPNLLTMLRLLLVGAFVGLFAAGQPYFALGVFLLAGATDYLDGYIARKYNLITSFGKLMDPLADKLMLLAALVCLATVKSVPVWAVWLVGCKELIMIVGGFAILRRGTVVQAGYLGKAASGLFIAAVAAAFFHDAIKPWDFALLCLAVSMSLMALVWYVTESVRGILGKNNA